MTTRQVYYGGALLVPVEPGTSAVAANGQYTWDDVAMLPLFTFSVKTQFEIVLFDDQGKLVSREVVKVPKTAKGVLPVVSRRYFV